ncbi:MAG: hypothetical protein AAB221_06195, partial [Bacteroidota bacterium]
LSLNISSVAAGQNITIYGNFSVSAYNLTNYTFNVYVDDVPFYINSSSNLMNFTSSDLPKTNDTDGGTNTGSFRYNLTVPDSFAIGSTHTVKINTTLNIISGGANATFTIADPDCDEGAKATLCVITTVRTLNGLKSYNNLSIRNGGALRNESTNGTSAFRINASQIEIQSGGKIEGNVNITTVNLTVLSGGVINATAYGYMSGASVNSNGHGPGAGISGVGGYGSGAGYGGKGGTQYNGGSGGPPYGSIIAPTDMGSGGGTANNPGGYGGGAIFINVTGTLNVSGIIISNSNETLNIDGFSGQGSGGSIYIIARNFTGNGILNASSGDIIANGKGGGGAGGRIAVYYIASTFNGIMQVSGEFGGNFDYGKNGTNFSAGSIMTQLSLNQTSGVVAGQNLTIYGNFSVSAYNLTNYTFNVYVDDVAYYLNWSNNDLENSTAINLPRTNDTDGKGTNTGSFRYNLTIPSSFAAGSTHTVTVNTTLTIISGTASATFTTSDPDCDEGTKATLCVITT